MSLDLITPEYLHKDELQYELEARGLSTEGSNVATLRSVFRTSRDLKENVDILATNKIFKDPVSALSFCRQRFNQIKDLVENTDLACITVDFPRYVHRLRHLATRLRHLLEFAKLGSDMRPAVLEFQEELHRLSVKTVDEFRTAGYIQPDQDQTTDTTLPHMTEGRSVYYRPSELARSEVLAAPCSQVSAQLPSSRQILAVPSGDNLTRSGAPGVFAKVPNPIQKMFQNLPVTDGLQVDSRITFLRVLVRMQYMSPAFGTPYTTKDRTVHLNVIISRCLWSRRDSLNSPQIPVSPSCSQSQPILTSYTLLS
jgi:hypothetical protein